MTNTETVVHPLHDGPRTVAARALEAIAPGPREIRWRSPILAPVLMVTALNLAVAAVMTSGAELYVPGGAAVAELVSSTIWLAALASPVVVPIKVFGLAALAWAALVLLDDELPFRPLASLIAYAEVVLAFGGACAAVAVLVAAQVGAGSPADVVARLSLSGLLGLDGSFLAATLSGVTLFHFAWLAFILVMLPKLDRLRRRTPVAVGAVLVGFMLAIGVIRALLFT